MFVLMVVLVCMAMPMLMVVLMGVVMAVPMLMVVLVSVCVAVPMLMLMVVFMSLLVFVFVIMNGFLNFLLVVQDTHTISADSETVFSAEQKVDTLLQRQGTQLLLQVVEWYAEVEQRSKCHVSRDTAKAVKMKVFHGRLSLLAILRTGEGQCGPAPRSFHGSDSDTVS